MIQIEFPERHAPARYAVRETGYFEQTDTGRRFLGQVIRHLGDPYETWVKTDCGPRNIGTSQSVPDGIDTILSFHKLTDYQYAPWPSMEEDEE
jgi:hypothetical protein